MGDIKNNKPKKGKATKFKQGYFKPKYPEKYRGKLSEIIYRSGLEYEVFKKIERCKSVIGWVAEPFGIKYLGEDKREHTYWIDLILYMENNKTYFCEIKPFQQTIKNSYDWERNKRKWNAAIKYCENETSGGRNTKFKMITEKFLKI